MRSERNVLNEKLLPHPYILKDVRMLMYGLGI